MKLFVDYAALFRSPCIDEPFSGLMPLHIESIKDLIVQAKSTKGIILSDHLYRHTMEMADDIYLLANAKTYLIKDREELVFRGYLPELSRV